MNDQTTARIAATLIELHQLFPAMRFGQLVLTVSQLAKGPTVESTYDVTDEEFLIAAEDLLLRRRQQVQSDMSETKVKRAV